MVIVANRFKTGYKRFNQTHFKSSQSDYINESDVVNLLLVGATHGVKNIPRKGQEQYK